MHALARGAARARFFDVIDQSCPNAHVIVALASHITFPRVFVRRYMDLDALSPPLFTLGNKVVVASELLHVEMRTRKL